jgi:precorrin-6B methylase 2
MELLVAAVAHFRVFERLEHRSLSHGALTSQLGLTDRAARVLLTGLRSLGLLDVTPGGDLTLPETVRHHLLPGGDFYIGDYFSLASHQPAVTSLVQRLRSSRPVEETSHGPGAAFIYREGIESAMEAADSARSLTLALTGRARNVAPLLAARLRFSPGDHLLDVGAGSGVYSLAALQAHPDLRVTAMDRPEVLKVVEEYAEAGGVRDRLTLLPGDMFKTPLPAADAILLSNVLHDWDIPECRALVDRCAQALNPGGRLLVHDAYLNDDFSGPLPVALYSVSLFTLTEGRAYSRAEVAGWLEAAGLVCGPVEPTLVHAGLLTGTAPSV